MSQFHNFLNEAISLHQNGCLVEAEKIYLKAIEINPLSFDAQHLLGIVSLQMGNFVNALNRFESAIRIDSTRAEVFINQGLAYKNLHAFASALESFNQAILLNSADAVAFNNRGNVLMLLEQFEDALVDYQCAINLKPDYVEAFYNRGGVYSKLGNYDLAILSYDMAIALCPIYADAFSNRGKSYEFLGKTKAAVRDYNLAINLEPENAYANFNLALHYLLHENFTKGWFHYEFRKKLGFSGIDNRNFKQSELRKIENIQNKTILLLSEQGLGDTIQFCRYAKLLSALGAIVIIEVQPPLVRLISKISVVKQVIAKGSSLPNFDYYISLLSLPFIFKTNLDNIPFAKGYLCPDNFKIKKWRQRLGNVIKPRIGIVWSGNPAHENDQNRSIPLKEFLQLVPDKLEVVVLQNAIVAEDYAVLANSLEFHCFTPEIVDFEDTAALCCLVDLVISVDTSVAHLAGALGIPVWILLPYQPDWRWLLHRQDTIWYESATLYRQEVRGDWRNVFKRVKSDLENMLQS